MSYIELATLIEKSKELDIQVLTGEENLNRHVTTIDVNRPGLALAGFFKNFAHNRIQVFGRGEAAPEQSERIRSEFFGYDYPGLIFTHANRPPDYFLETAEKSGTPLMTTGLTTHDFILLFTQIMTQELTPSTSIHGVLIEVFGVGILLMGESGIGKSETALELVERGHRLVADDIVIIKCLGNTTLYGEASEIIRHHMELRGLGIINVKDLFGVGAIRGHKRIELVIGLEEWDPNKEYERLSLDEEHVEILGVKLPRLLIPVRPGRNVPILIETAAMNHRSKKMGYHAARELSNRINDEIHKKGKNAVKNTNHST